MMLLLYTTKAEKTRTPLTAWRISRPIPERQLCNTAVPASFAVGSVRRFIRLRTVPSVMLSFPAAWATGLGVGLSVRFSPTWEILETNRIGATRPLEAMLVALCYANKGFSMSVPEDVFLRASPPGLHYDAPL